MPFSRGKLVFFLLEAKKEKKKTKHQKKRKVQGQVRWPFGPPHLTLKPSKKTKQKTNKEGLGPSEVAP